MKKIMRSLMLMFVVLMYGCGDGGSNKANEIMGKIAAGHIESAIEGADIKGSAEEISRMKRVAKESMLRMGEGVQYECVNSGKINFSLFGAYGTGTSATHRCNVKNGDDWGYVDIVVHNPIIFGESKVVGLNVDLSVMYDKIEKSDFDALISTVGAVVRLLKSGETEEAEKYFADEYFEISNAVERKVVYEMVESMDIITLNPRDIKTKLYKDYVTGGDYKDFGVIVFYGDDSNKATINARVMKEMTTGEFKLSVFYVEYFKMDMIVG